MGIQTSSTGSTDYNKLIAALRVDLGNTTVRSSRQPSVIFKAMRALNRKFSGEIVEQSINPFPEQYFTCPIICASCNRRCQRSMGHDGETHLNLNPCQHQHQFENRVELCKLCYNNGREVIITRIDGWTHCVINCPHCGEIARTFKYWGTIQECEAVRAQTVHVWKDSNLSPKGPSHSGQMVLDKVSYVCEAFTNFSSQPTGALKEWCADKVAPKYWRPNHEIMVSDMLRNWKWMEGDRWWLLIVLQFLNHKMLRVVFQNTFVVEQRWNLKDVRIFEVILIILIWWYRRL